MRALGIVTVLALLAVLASARAAEEKPPEAKPAGMRTWTDSTGQFNIDAELVQFINGNVFLKKADGSTVTLPSSKLSEADQKFLEEKFSNKEEDLDKTLPLDFPGSKFDLGEVKITGEAKYKEQPKGAISTIRTAPPLIVSLKLSATPLARAASFGSVKLEKFDLDNGLQLSLMEPKPGEPNPISGFAPVDRNSPDQKLARHEILVPLQFVSPGPSPKKIALLTGTVKVRVAGAEATKDIDVGVPQNPNGMILKQSGFAQAQVALRIDGIKKLNEFEEYEMRLTARGGYENIKSISLITAKGDTIPSRVGWHNKNSAKDQDVTINWDNELPTGSKIRFNVAIPPDEARVPFELKDVALPPPPAVQLIQD